MPTTVNGIGTHYYGKSNPLTRKGHCEHCGQFGTLTSYDTWLCACVLFIPVLPLGKKRIVDKCGYCTKHFAMPLKQWEANRARDLQGVITELQNDPDNPEIVRKAIGVAVGYQDHDTLETLSAGAEQFLADNADVQTMLAGAWEYFGEDARAEKAQRAVLALRSDPENGVPLALNLLRQKRPDEAAPLLQFILDEKREAQKILPVALAETYNETGHAEKALDVLDEAYGAFPSLEEEKTFRNAWKAAARGVPPARRDASPFAGRGARRIRYDFWRRWGLGAAAVMAAVLIYTGVCFWMGRSRTVFLVNGLDRAYAADVNGTSVTLSPNAYRPFDIAEGNLHVAVVDSELQIPDATHSVTTPFWTRPFLKRTFVINPDATAVIEWEQTVYVPKTVVDNSEPKFEYNVGRPFYVFHDIDFPFGQFPQTLHLDSSSKRVYRERIGLVRDAEAGQVLAFLAEKQGAEAAGRWARTRLLAAPHDINRLGAASQWLPTEEYLSLLRGGLDAEPLRIQWHRAYQETMESAHPEYDLAAEYRQRLASAPENPDCLYLLGRITRDYDRAETLYRQAIENDPPSAFAYNALAFCRVAEGRFEEALAMARKALALQPDDPGFHNNEVQALLGMGALDELLQSNRQAREAAPDDPGLHFEAMRLHAMAGHPEDAKEAADRFAELMGGADEAAAESFRQFNAAWLHYYAGQMQAYIDAMAAAGHGGIFAVQISKNKLADAQAALSGQNAPYMHLLLYLAATRAEEKELASQALATAIEQLGHGNAEARILASTLAGETPVDEARILRLPQEANDKRVALCALGVKYPEHREVFFNLARRLNFDREFPYLTLIPILGGAETTPAAPTKGDH